MYRGYTLGKYLGSKYERSISHLSSSTLTLIDFVILDLSIGECRSFSMRNRFTWQRLRLFRGSLQWTQPTPYCQETRSDRTVNVQLGVHSRCFPLRTPFFLFPKFFDAVPIGNPGNFCDLSQLIKGGRIHPIPLPFHDLDLYPWLFLVPH